MYVLNCCCECSILGHVLNFLVVVLLQVSIEDSLVTFQVFKRPHVDYFLSTISQWYDLVVFTASLEVYGSAVVKRLDKGKNLFKGCLFRQHCTMDMYGYTKDLTVILPDLSNIFILDNSPGAYRSNPDNAIPIKSWFYDPHDTALLNLLPALDALRFTNDVRSVLSRNLHIHSL
jgi:CTD nuclear envelope phosphatase 1